MILKDNDKKYVFLVDSVSDIATEYEECAVAVCWVLLICILTLRHLLCSLINSYQNSSHFRDPLWLHLYIFLPYMSKKHFYPFLKTDSCGWTNDMVSLMQATNFVPV